MSIIFTVVFWYLVYRWYKRKRENEEVRKVQEQLNQVRESQGLKPIRNYQKQEEHPTHAEYKAHYRDYGNEKGEKGEWLTEYALKTIDGRRFILRNVYIPYHGGTSELDLILLHEKGIYVIESKNYSGWIFGSIDRQYWTQSFNKRTRYKFYNPIMQNRTHIKAVRASLGLPESVSIKSFIVFSERCELKDVPPSTNEVIICQRHHMMRMLREDLEHRPVIYELSTLDDFKNRLHKYTIVTVEEKERHIQQAQKYKRK